MKQGRPHPKSFSEAATVAALMLLPLLFWWRLWAFDPADRAVLPEGDLTSQYYPLQSFSARELVEGRLPAWNPYLNAGQPGLADIQTGAFYPLNLLPNLFLALVGWPFGPGILTVQVILHFSLASLFTYLFVRRLAHRAGARTPAARFAGAVAATSFTYAGYLTSFPVQQLTILETAVWLPLVLFLQDHAFHNTRPLAHLILAAMALACALLAGHPQTAMYLVYAVFAYGLFLLCGVRRSSQPAGRPVLALVPRLLPLLGFLALACLLASVQLVPALGFIIRSTRSGLDYDAVAWGFPLAEITHLLYPGYFGGSPQYVGILPPILAGAALMLRGARRQVFFWISIALVALVLAFGGNAFLYNLFYLLAPGFAAVRNQERVIYLFSFATSVLAGYGALTLVQPLPRLARRAFVRFGRGLAWTTAVFLALTALFYAGHLQSLQQGVQVNLFEGVLRHHTLLLLVLVGGLALWALRMGRVGIVRRSWLAALALSLILLNLFTVNWRYNLAEPGVGGPFPTSGVVDYLREQPGVFRISSAGLLPGGASAGAVYEIEDITANTPLRLDRFEKFEDGVGSWRRWQLLNVRYVLDRRDLDTAGLQKVYEQDDIRVYRLGDPLPRAWVVHRVVTAGDPESLALIDDADFDPRAEAILPPGAGVQAMPGAGEPGETVQVIEAEPGRLVLQVSAASDGLLVISQPFYPGWRAWLDGSRVTLHRADYLLQGVWVGAGAHRVELAYHLSTWPAIVTLGVWLGCLVALFLWLPRAKSRPEAGQKT